METNEQRIKRLTIAASKKGLHVRPGMIIVLPNDTTYQAKDIDDLSSFIRDY